MSQVQTSGSPLGILEVLPPHRALDPGVTRHADVSLDLGAGPSLAVLFPGYEEMTG